MIEWKKPDNYTVFKPGMLVKVNNFGYECVEIVSKNGVYVSVSGDVYCYTSLDGPEPEKIKVLEYADFVCDELENIIKLESAEEEHNR